MRLTVDTPHITQAWGVYSNELVGFTRAAADAHRVYFRPWGYQDVTRYSGLVGLDLGGENIDTSGLVAGCLDWLVELGEGTSQVGEGGG